MSTRKPSEPTSRPTRRQPTRYLGFHHVARLLVILGIATLVLAGCTRGDASDAEQGKRADAQRTSVIDGLQATESARLLLPGTPAPTSTFPPE